MRFVNKRLKRIKFTNKKIDFKLIKK